MKRTVKILTSSAAALALLLLAGASAQAATATGTLTVTASVAKQCSLGSPTLAFGAYDPTSPTPLDVNASLTVNCTKTTPFTIGLSLGANAVTTNRFMKDPVSADTLQYELYTSAARTTVWNSTNTVAGVGVTNPSETIFGRIPAGQFVTPAAGYSDTVTATINF